jgi:GNAT superfamily N-acetyltransferase
MEGEVTAVPAVISIREITLGDAADAAGLSEELGYPATIEAIEQRIRSLGALKDHAVFVACLPSGRVVGWIDVAITHHLQADPCGEIGGLVVSSEVRSGGIGRRLVAEAERWAADRGIKRMIVRSRVSREAAHRFYERERYSRIKTSAVFSKDLE